MKNKTSKRRTDLVLCLLDLLDFIEEKIREAVVSPPSQFAAVSEAAGVLPFMMDRLREDEHKLTTFLLALGSMRFEEGYWQDWWLALAKAKREGFLKDADDLLERVQALKQFLSA